MSQSSSDESTLTLRITGMTCGSCELLLERKLKTVPGIQSVHVNHKTGIAKFSVDPQNLPSEDAIISAIREAGYSVAEEGAPTVASVASFQRKWMEIGASLLIMYALYTIVKSYDLVSLAPSTTDALSWGGVFLIGLIAGTSSCLAVTGGLLLSMAAKYNEVHQGENSWQKFVPLLQFNIGRLVSYFVLGGFVGLLGSTIVLSTRMTGYMSIIVALIMLYLALTILQIIPKGTLPIRPPKRLSHWIAGLSESHHPDAPFLLGAMTFFLPCGFTQSLQLAALASGSFITGALTMGIFALGTLPALLGISAISSTARGSFSRIFLRFSGTLVLVLALFNLQSGLALAGIDIGVVSANQSRERPATSSVTDGVQEVAMKVSAYGYEPSTLSITAGVPVRWVIDGTNATGCTSSIVIPDLGVSKILSRGKNVIEFTAPKKGTLAFSCGMGMVRGRFNVL